VVAWDSSDEQDAGWFMGVLQGTGAKGAFPINYTRKYNTNKTVKNADPDPLQDTFQSVDLSLDDEWRNPSAQGAEYINLPELPEELPLTNGNLYSEDSHAHVEREPVEYSIPPRVPPKRPAAPVIESPVTVEAPELAAAAKVDIPSVEVEVKAAAVFSVDTPEVELEVEKPEVSVEISAVSVGKAEVSVETPEVSVETPEVSVETPEVSVETPVVSIETPEVSIETPEVSAEIPESPAVSVEANVETSGEAEGSGAVDTAVEAAAEASVEVPDVQLGLKADIPVEIEVSVEAKVSDEDKEVAEVKTPTEESEEDHFDSDSGDDLTPEEVQQKLAALGEFSDENNESSDEDDPRVRFETSVSILESVPEDATDSEGDSETSSVEDPGVELTKPESDDDVTAL